MVFACRVCVLGLNELESSPSSHGCLPLTAPPSTTTRLKLASVPYPFTSAEQYERSLRRPIGREWNTSLSVREAVRPAVRVKPGTMVSVVGFVL
jgi:hypothetical protein